jgi:hypothetical protein
MTSPVASFAAVLAGAAGADAGDQDAVAGREPAYVVADLVDGAHGFVAENPPGVHLGNVARQDVQIGTADGGRVDPDGAKGPRMRTEGLVPRGPRVARVESRPTRPGKTVPEGAPRWLTG